MNSNSSMVLKKQMPSIAYFDTSDITETLLKSTVNTVSLSPPTATFVSVANSTCVHYLHILHVAESSNIVTNVQTSDMTITVYAIMIQEAQLSLRDRESMLSVEIW